MQTLNEYKKNYVVNLSTVKARANRKNISYQKALNEIILADYKIYSAKDNFIPENEQPEYYNDIEVK
mgnify:CR=1 FL=1